MTGLSTIEWFLDDDTGTFPYDITPYVQVWDGWDFERGRTDEDDQVEAKSLKLVLTNDDGRFVMGLNPYDCHLDQRLRMQETVGGVTYVRFTGYVQDWPTEWPTPLTMRSTTPITVSDRPTRLERRKLKSLVENEILRDEPVAYYRLSEEAGAASAGDTSGNGHTPLTPAGTGTPVAFGTPTGTSTDDLTAATFAGAGGQYLSAAFAQPGDPFTIECFFICAAATATTQVLALLVRNDDGVNQGGLVINPTTGTLSGGGTESAVSVTDGVLHHAAVTVNGLATELFLDGVSVDTGVLLAPLTATDLLIVGGSTTALSVRLAGVVGHVAFYDKVLAADRIADHSHARSDGFSTERTDERLARLLSYANIDAGDMDLEPGITSNVPRAPVAGQSALAGARELDKAEGGVLFTAGDGRMTFHNRQHRVLTATQAAALAIDAGDVDGLRFSGARDYLFNTATGSRTGGAEQRIAAASSVETYEEYPDDLGTLLVSTDAEVLDRLNWIVAMYQTPRARVSQIVLDLLTLPEATVQAALSLELGDRLTIASLPPQAPVVLADVLVEGFKEAGTHKSWTLTLNTVPADLFRAWILGDATYGVLGTTTRLHH